MLGLRAQLLAHLDHAVEHFELQGVVFDLDASFGHDDTVLFLSEFLIKLVEVDDDGALEDQGRQGMQDAVQKHLDCFRHVVSCHAFVLE